MCEHVYLCIDLQNIFTIYFILFIYWCVCGSYSIYIIFNICIFVLELVYSYRLIYVYVCIHMCDLCVNTVDWLIQ